MVHKREHCLLMLFMFATCFLPSLGDNAQVLLNFRSSLSNADALNNWGNEAINLCSWTGILCVNLTFHGLRLENMGLSGTINVDALLELSTLNTFSVINNSFEGPMPAFNKLVKLRALFLTNNKFSGEIPNGAFEGMKRLKRVFLAENGFTGPIPISLAILPKLVDVDLHGNSFDGNIPEFHRSDFRVFNLSNNRLEGPIPESLSNKDPSSFVGNQGLCGKPLSPCPSITPSPSGQRPNLTHTNQDEEHKKKRLLLTAIVVVGVIVMASVVALLFIRYRRRKSGQPVSVVEEAQPQNTNSVSSGSKSMVLASSESKKSEDGSLNFVRKEREVFDLQDLLRASAEVLGSGSFGSTYKAMVLSGPVVVVKRFKNMNNVGKRDFFEHMKRLGRLTHPNLLPLVAFYYGKQEKLLVNDFAENGSLACHLHGMVYCELDWGTRLKIIKGVGRGLAYLYKEFPDKDLPHGHLKSSNVVLDNSFEPRLAEYGLVAVVDKSHAQQFMVAYKSPEVSQNERPSEKSDVWCLGILILELLTGKFPANYLRHGKGASEDLGEWVKSIAREGWSGEVFDKDIMGRRSGEGEMLKLLRIGMACCEWDLENRLGWKEAVAKIEELKERDSVDDGSEGIDHLYSSTSISQDDTLSFVR
ncbi:pollen receptor-like kinase 5 [Abrus precatorius]|uniref:Pollen receptor-like kinase 5 n=1 Tax=Abrus precatorius TaxID=3816 RepID=A0A8B8LPT7_ABRPR|nr:pollen receptor-like kinase 5 [Abrus precatorius]